MTMFKTYLLVIISFHTKFYATIILTSCKGKNLLPCPYVKATLVPDRPNDMLKFSLH